MDRKRMRDPFKEANLASLEQKEHMAATIPISELIRWFHLSLLMYENSIACRGYIYLLSGGNRIARMDKLFQHFGGLVAQYTNQNESKN